MDYKELKEKAENLKEAQNTKAKENYHYARFKGFTSREAVYLQSASKEEIDRLAKERDEAKDGDNNG